MSQSPSSPNKNSPSPKTPQLQSPNVMPSNSFSVENLLSAKQKSGDSPKLIKPIPMLCTPTTSTAESTVPSLPPYYCFLRQPNFSGNQMPQTPHPMAIASAMAALNGGIVDPATLMMLQSLAASRTHSMSMAGLTKQTESSPNELNTSTSSSPQCMIPNASFSNWLTPSTEMSSSSSSGQLLSLKLFVGLLF